jgi:prepilin-type N-terminal cleavage/methylation domain-containing protein
MRLTSASLVRHRRGTRRERGFSLLEVAITLGVLAILLGGLLVPLTTQIALRNETATYRMLEEIKEALIGYAAANGRLPCPASGASNGQESFGASGDASNGDCGSASGGVFVGFVPAVSLGLTPIDSQGFAVDGWGTTQNRIRYAVSSETLNGITFPFTQAGGMRRATMSWVAGAELLHVCASGTGPALSGTPAAWHCAATGDATNTLTFNAPVVIWSVGANAATTGGVSTDEIQNPNPMNGTSLDRIFVSRGRSSSPEFDDIVTWISPGRLVNRMIMSGQLP